MTRPVAPSLDEPFDVAVIGAGVIGCAMFREFVLAGASTILVDREPDIIGGASKGNSAILHTGFDAPPRSIEARCIRSGNRRYRDIRERLNLPLLATGAIVVAWTQGEASRLADVVEKARKNGAEVRTLTANEVLIREPRLAKEVVAGVLISQESVIDPWSAPYAYALQGLANGGRVSLGVDVVGGELNQGFWRLATNAGAAVCARTVINCAGNYGDLVEAIARPSPFTIRPRKGQFVVFDKSAGALVQSIILPVPTERTKGVVITPTAFGNLLVGPTAEDQQDRRTAAVDHDVLAGLIATGGQHLPDLTAHAVTAVFAGLRPATEFGDYQIEAIPERQWLTVAGIRSTGLSSALGVSAYVRELYENHFSTLTPLRNPVWTPVPNLSETQLRPYASHGRTPIVCHCELVTEREIIDAMRGGLPACSLGGLKRRTRVMMGRCQGFYCSRRVLELAQGRLAGLPKQ
jgi:glycerol-3-phosphate dehydrogenase